MPTVPTAHIDAIVASVAAQGGLERKVEALVVQLADCVKATSNDQNVQRLAHDLRAAAPALIEAIAAKADV